MIGSLPSAIGVSPPFGLAMMERGTQVTLPTDIVFTVPAGAPPNSYEYVHLFDDPDRHGPYCTFVRWHPGFMSAPHTYRTDRICAVISGTWWVDGGADYNPAESRPVGAGGFVLRVAKTPHYDGVISTGIEPVTVAIFGTGPVCAEFLAPDLPLLRQA